MVFFVIDSAAKVAVIGPAEQPRSVDRRLAVPADPRTHMFAVTGAGRGSMGFSQRSYGESLPSKSIRKPALRRALGKIFEAGLGKCRGQFLHKPAVRNHVVAREADHDAVVGKTGSSQIVPSKDIMEGTANHADAVAAELFCQRIIGRVARGRN